ncbi:MAG TPA: sulfotransferase [Pirellulales bacterium]|jgi:tetratricopeptide (TPR) repeat protein|nr:sulfotransferase [Pirellulales bacterium]
MTTSSQPSGERTQIDALVALAEGHYRAGRLAEAADVLRQILALRPDIAEMHNYLGRVLLGQRKLDEAAAEFEQATALKPSLFDAHGNLGNILRQQGKLDQAAARFRQVIALRPDLAASYNNLGNVLLNQGKADQAVVQFEQALALQPDFAEAYNNLGAALRMQGRLAEATARFEQALALMPDNAEAHNNLGNILWEQGKFAEAAARYDRALALKPDYAEAHYDRSDLKTFRPGDSDLAALEALAAEPDRLPPQKMLFIHFALGKALEDVGDYPRAFQHFLQGNALRRREITYNEANFQRHFQRVAEAFDASLLDRFRDAGDPSSTPIFVLGMPRSGSTLVEQILASHPQIQAAGELWNLDRVVRAVTDMAGQPAPFPTWLRGINAEGMRRLGQAYLASLPALAAGKTRIIDKAPSNFLYVGLIRLILPNAHVIHTVRDPVDTCISCFSRLFNQGQLFSYDLGELGRYFRWYHEVMAHWRAILPAGAMLDVAYEDVIDNLEEQARRLIDFCGLSWDDRCLNFHKTRRPIATASNVQVRQPLYRSSVARWRRYEAWLQPLLAELENCRQPE